MRKLIWVIVMFIVTGCRATVRHEASIDTRLVPAPAPPPTNVYHIVIQISTNAP
jgi:hypothetical protein